MPFKAAIRHSKFLIPPPLSLQPPQKQFPSCKYLVNHTTAHLHHMNSHSPFRYFLIALLSAATLNSCTINQGNMAIKDFGRYTDLEKGKSKKSDVYTSFSQPHDVKYQGADSQWVYYNLQSTMSAATFIPFIGLIAGGMNNQVSQADFFFDSRDVLLRYSTSQRSKFTNSFVGVVQGTASHMSNTQAERVQKEMSKYNYTYDKKEARKARDVGTVIGVQR